MDDKGLECLLKNAFDGVRCEENLKSQTLERLMNGRTKRRQRMFARTNPNFSLKMRCMAAAVCCVIASVSMLGVYSVPAAAICLDGDMSMRVVVNRFDRVLDVAPYNENAKVALRNLNTRVKGTEGKELLRHMVASKPKSDVEVFIISDNEKLSGAILADVTKESQVKLGVSGQAQNLTDGIVCQIVPTKVNEYENAHADKNKMTYQRYELYKKIQVLGIGLTENQVRDMSLNDLRVKIAKAEMQISSSEGNEIGKSNVVGENEGAKVEICHGQGTVKNDYDKGLEYPIIPEDQLLEENAEIKIDINREIILEEKVESNAESEFVLDAEFEGDDELKSDAEYSGKTETWVERNIK